MSLKGHAATFESLEQRTLLAAATYEVIRGALYITGTEKADRIVISKDNQLFAADGPYSHIRKFIIDGRGGNDLIRIDFGAGVLNVRARINGGAGKDTIFATRGADTLLGGDGSDFINARAGNDRVRGGAGDTLRGGDGDDFLIGSHVFYGDAGNDQIHFDDAGATISGGEGNDMIRHLPGSEGLGNDSVDGGNGDDTILGGLGQDELRGGAGDDWIEGYGQHTDQYGDEGNDHLVGGRFLFGGGGDDTLLAESGGDGTWLIGGDGDDTLIGSDRAELMAGYAGNDFVDGRGGNDSILGSDSGGFDTVYAGEGDDVVGGVGYLDGGLGNDEIAFDFNDDADSIDDTTVLGGDGDDYIHPGDPYNGAGDDLIDGGSGNDTIVAGPGNDTVYGGAGNDFLSDRFILGYHDPILLGKISFMAFVEGYVEVTGESGVDSLVGGDGIDTLHGDDGHGGDYLEAGGSGEVWQYDPGDTGDFTP